MHKRSAILFNIALLIFFSRVQSQDCSRFEKVVSFPDKLFAVVDKKARGFEEKLQMQTEKYLSKIERQEQKLKKKLWRKDSTLANEIFGNIDQKYDQLKNISGQLNHHSSVYSDRLDSITTALNFLQSRNLATSPEALKLLESYKSLQQQFNVSEQIRKQLIQRQQMLKEQFEKLGMVKQLRQFRKQVYYYQAQVREYKEMFEDPAKMEAKIMQLVMQITEFKEFFARNSMLGSLFALPGAGVNGSNISLAGLQTRASVNQAMVARFGTGADVASMLQQNMQSAQGQLNVLKNKISSFSSGSYGNGDADAPDFKPNQQKTKSFLNRLEYGANMQSQKARYFFPVTSDIGLSLGYKLNDKSVVGIGASYKLGWGRGWDHIAITHQGVGLRSYLDWQIKGSFYVSGGYEQNYQSMINDMDQLKDYSAWQRSGLIGLSKRYKVSKKLKGEMKILWDFLSYQQVPRTQAIVFRIGYRLK